MFSEVIAVTTNLKTLKMMKNKLTDDGISILCDAIIKNGKIQVAYLNYNSFSEKSLEFFSKFFSIKAFSLKKLYLQNNNISAAKGKSFVKEAKNYDIDIYV